MKSFIDRNRDSLNIKIRTNNIQKVEKFNYLGSIITKLEEVQMTSHRETTLCAAGACQEVLRIFLKPTFNLGQY